MTEHDPSEPPRRTGERSLTGPAPVAAVVTTARRRRPRTGALVVAGLVAAGIAGAVLVTGHGRSPAPRLADTSPTPGGTLSDRRSVGLGHVAIDVPRGWATNATRCGTPQKDTVVIDVGATPACAEPRPAGVESIAVVPGEARFDFEADRALTIEGVNAQRQATVCTQYREESRVCAGTVYIPTMEVAFRAESSTGAAEVDRILRRIRMTPSRVGVPGYEKLALDDQARSGEAYAAVLTRLGLDARLRTRKSPRLDPGYVVGVSPQPGTMVRPGATITVTVTGTR